MKNVKNISLAITIAALINTQCTQSAVPVIEIYNKSNNVIKVTIFAGPNRVSTDAVVYSNDTWKPTQAVDPNSVLDIHITDGRVYHFNIQAPGKTKYLTWNPAKSMPLYPETGPLLGLMGQTKSGLSLKNNVSSSQITQK